MYLTKACTPLVGVQQLECHTTCQALQVVVLLSDTHGYHYFMIISLKVVLLQTMPALDTSQYH